MSASFDHLFMLVSDLQRSLRFYRDGMGLEVTVEDGGHARLQGSEGFFIGLEEGSPERIGSAGIEIVIRVDDVDRRHAALIDAGLVFVAPPADQEWGARHAWLFDPDGYRLSIFSPIDEAGA